MDPLHSTDILSDYADLAEAFSKAKLLKLPHIGPATVLSNYSQAPPPKGRIFPLSQPETESMRTYIEEELAKASLFHPSLLRLLYSLSRRERGLFGLVLSYKSIQ